MTNIETYCPFWINLCCTALLICFVENLTQHVVPNIEGRLSNSPLDQAGKENKLEVFANVM